GLAVYRMVHQAFRHCVGRKVRIGIMAEQNFTGGLVESLRLMSARLKYLQHGRRVDFLLGIGSGAARWFGNVGFETRRIYEFSYFPPLPTTAERADATLWRAPGVRLLFIGRLARQKRVDLMLSALSGLRGLDWSLAIIGSGSE